MTNEQVSRIVRAIYWVQAQIAVVGLIIALVG
jgi:hypothetical protein